MILMISNDKIKIIKKVLVDALAPYFIYIFGSTVKGSGRIPNY